MTTKNEKKSTGKQANITPVTSYEDETPTDLMLMIDDVDHVVALLITKLITKVSKI